MSHYLGKKVKVTDQNGEIRIGIVTADTGVGLMTNIGVCVTYNGYEYIPIKNHIPTRKSQYKSVEFIEDDEIGIKAGDIVIGISTYDNGLIRGPYLGNRMSRKDDPRTLITVMHDGEKYRDAYLDNILPTDSDGKAEIEKGSEWAWCRHCYNSVTYKDYVGFDKIYKDIHTCKISPQRYQVDDKHRGYGNHCRTAIELGDCPYFKFKK